MKDVRKIIFHGHYFTDFYVEQSKGVQEKIEYVFTLIRQVKIIPARFLKHIEGTDGLLEIRIEYQSNIYRIFCCFERGNLVVLFNAFQKKTQKTPGKEIELALKLKKDYFNKKSSQNDKERKNRKS